MKQFAKYLYGAAAGICLAAPVNAATLDDITLGASLASANELEIIADDFQFEATDFSDVFVLAPLDGLDAVDAGFAVDGDLEFYDLFGDLALSGTAKDIGFDGVNDTISILFGLSVNTFSADTLAVAVLTLSEDTFTGITPSFDDLFISTFADLDGTLMDVEIFGASVPAIPLPAGLPLLLMGVGGFAMIRRRQSRANA